MNFALRAPLSVRHSRRVNRGKPHECWEWTGGRDRDGYGTITDETGAPKRAHRVAWQLANGGIDPAPQQVCHTCDNPPCQNPAHLFLGTNAQNVADKIAKGRARGNQTGSIGNYRRRLTDEQVAEIRETTGGHAAVGRKYGISGEHVRRIRNGTRR